MIRWAMLLVGAAPCVSAQRQTFKFGAIISGDAGLRTTETHGEHNPAKKITAMRTWVHRTQQLGGIPVGFQPSTAVGAPSRGFVDFELVVHPENRTEHKACVGEAAQAAAIADDTAFVVQNNITAVFLADCFVLDWAGVLVNDTITNNVPVNRLFYISYFNRARYANFASLGVTVFHADAQNSELKGYYGNVGWSVDVDRTTKGKALVKKVAMQFQSSAGYAPKVAILRLNENGWYADRVRSRVALLEQYNREVVYNEVLAPFANGCKEPIYSVPCANDSLAGGAADGCCSYSNIRSHLKAINATGANVLIVYVWCEGRIIQQLMQEMNIHMDVFYSINCIDSQLGDGVDPEDLEYLVMSKVWTPDSQGVDPLFGDNQMMIEIYDNASTGVAFAALDDWTARYPLIGTILTEAVRSLPSLSAVFDFTQLNLMIQENVLPETYFGEIRYRNFRYNNGFETIEVQMLGGDSDSNGTVGAVTVLPDSMAAASLVFPMPTWECRGSVCDCPAGAGHVSNHQRCEPCVPGFFSPGGAVACTACPSGSISQAASAACEDCPADWFQRLPAQSVCEECPVNFECTGGTVEPASCQPGFGPKTNVTGCQPCTGNNYSEYGHCMPCLGDVHKGRTLCKPCPSNQAADPPELGCRCAVGFINTSFNVHCVTADYAVAAMPPAACMPCDVMACVDECHNDQLTITPGWGTLQGYESDDRPIFKCNSEDSCPGGMIISNDTTCKSGYEGTLCGDCQDGFSVQADGTCDICGSTSWLTFVLAVFTALFFVLVIILIKKYYSYFSILILVLDSDLKSIGKIVIATGQIIAGLAGGLNVRMPDVFGAFTVGFLGIFKFDLMPVLGIGCLSDTTYVAGLLGNFALVFLAVLLVGIHYLVITHKIRADTGHDVEGHRKLIEHMYHKFDRDGEGITLEEVRLIVQKVDPSTTADQVEEFFKTADTHSTGRIDHEEFVAAFVKDHDADDHGLDLRAFIQKTQVAEVRQDAVGRLFLMVFLLYPGLTGKIFEAFRCRELGSDHSVLLADYTIDCLSPDYSLLVSIAVGLVLLWPIGVPAMLLYQLIKHKDLIRDEDEDIVKEFDFVIKDYERKYYWWEVVELFRKLVLSGLIGVAGRGSILQSVVACVIAFFFFALSLTFRPYTSKSLNVVKLCSEFQIFGVLLICIVLQVNAMGLDNEQIGVDAYGNILVALTIMILPISLVFIKSSLEDVVEEAHHGKDKAPEGVEAPQSIGVKVRNPILSDESEGDEVDDSLSLNSAAVSSSDFDSEVSQRAGQLVS